jgi:hypothetical protein
VDLDGRANCLTVQIIGFLKKRMHGTRVHQANEGNEHFDALILIET